MRSSTLIAQFRCRQLLCAEWG